MNRREFLEVLAAASAGGFPLAGRGATARNASKVYDVPRFGNVHLLHFTDCHGQLLPTYFREPSVNLGLGDAAGHPPHLVSEAFLRHFGVAPGTRDAYAFTSRDFIAAARTYGKVGGFAHLATLVERLSALSGQLAARIESLHRSSTTRKRGALVRLVQAIAAYAPRTRLTRIFRKPLSRCRTRQGGRRR